MHRTAGASAAGNWVNCCQNRGSLPPILLGNPAPAKSGNPPLIGPAVGFSLWGNCCCWYSQFAATWCSRVYCRNGLEHCVVEPRVNHFPAVAWTELQKLNSYFKPVCNWHHPDRKETWYKIQSVKFKSFAVSCWELKRFSAQSCRVTVSKFYLLRFWKIVCTMWTSEVSVPLR